MNNKYTKYLLCFTALLCAFAFSKAYGQDKDIPKELYTTVGIPDSLKEDANSVVRYSMDEVKIKGPGNAVIKHHRIVTILNEKGDKSAIVVLGYNRKYDTYSGILITVYDENGKSIKKYHKSDMYDGSASNDETIVTEDRFLGLKHTIAKYPSTIEVYYEEDLTSFISLDTWHIQDKIEQSVQNADYKVSADPSMGFRYKNKNTSIEPEKSGEKSG